MTGYRLNGLTPLTGRLLSFFIDDGYNRRTNKGEAEIIKLGEVMKKAAAILAIVLTILMTGGLAWANQVAIDSGIGWLEANQNM